MIRTTHVLVAVLATCAAANLVLAALWSSRVLVATGAAWLLLALVLGAHPDDEGEPPAATPDADDRPATPDADHRPAAPDADHERGEPVAG